MRTNRIGVMGGTFDPPHLGHLAAAEAAIDEFELSRVLFVPNGHPPHKDPAAAATPDHRYGMTAQAVAGNRNFAVSRVELDRPGPHYTVDTLALLQQQYCDTELFFIAGADMILDLPNWRSPERLLQEHHVIAVSRPGYSLAGIEDVLGSFFHSQRHHIHLLPALGVAVSSTEVRERLLAGLSVRYLVPNAVLEYIDHHGLYRKSACERAPLPPLDEVLAWLRGKLKPSRYHHTVRVVATARELAQQHGVDVKLAEVAAALHDCARDLSLEEQRDLVLGSVADESVVRLNPGPLLHAKAGSVLACQQWGITDKSVVDAIRYHTTGRANMTPLEKVVFIADYIEPGRKFTGISLVRQKARVDLDAAVLLALDKTISYVVARREVLHCNSVEARNHLLSSD